MNLNQDSPSTGFENDRMGVGVEGLGGGGGETRRGNDASHFSEAQCCVQQTLIFINFSKHKGTTTGDFPFLSFLPADHFLFL